MWGALRAQTAAPRPHASTHEWVDGLLEIETMLAPLPREPSLRTESMIRGRRCYNRHANLCDFFHTPPISSTGTFVARLVFRGATLPHSRSRANHTRCPTPSRRASELCRRHGAQRARATDRSFRPLHCSDAGGHERVPDMSRGHRRERCPSPNRPRKCIFAASVNARLPQVGPEAHAADDHEAPNHEPQAPLCQSMPALLPVPQASLLVPTPPSRV